MMPRRRSLLLLPWLLTAGCAPEPTTGAATSTTTPAAHAPAGRPEMVRLSFLPDDNVAAVEAIAAPRADYRGAALGNPGRYERAIDYQACVNGLASNRLDLVWLGGVTFCQARERTGGQVEVVACRDIDLQFKSYVVANHAVVAAGRLRAVDDLQQWRGKLGDLTFSFGAKDSTSGHIMPRHFLLAAGIQPEHDFAAAPLYQLLGGHAATFRAVASGQVDLGVMNYAVYEKQAAADRERAPVVHTTPPFVDYCFGAHRRLGPATITQLRAALLALDLAQPAHAAILQAWKCQRFVAADATRWDAMAKVLAELPKDFLK